MSESASPSTKPTASSGAADLSISSDGRETLAGFEQKVAAGEAGGAHTLWIANHLFQRDPVTMAAIALARTRRMRVALMAVSPFTVHPVQTAMAAATLDELYPGRVILCFGVGAPADLKSVGIETERPVVVMREALGLVRAVLKGDAVHFRGQAFSVLNRRIANGAHDIPLMLAASGPRMLELAGTLADGVLISAGTSPEFVEWTLGQVRRAANGRPVRTHALVYAAIDDNATLAHQRLRRKLAILLRGSHHAENLRLAGSVLNQDALNAAGLAEDWPGAEALITDEIVGRHAASGRPHQVRERFAQYRAAGLDEIIVAGVDDGADIAKLMRAA